MGVTTSTKIHVGKTMPSTNHLGMVNIPPIIYGDDWGMVQMALFYPHYSYYHHNWLVV